MIRACPDKFQPEGDIDGSMKIEGLYWNKPLVVVKGDNHIELPFPHAMKNRIGRQTIG